jgi:hypothetical protein
MSGRPCGNARSSGLQTISASCSISASKRAMRPRGNPDEKPETPEEA